MLGALLQNTYVLVVLMALLTSVLAYAFSRLTDTDPARPNRTFFKTLVSGLAAGLALAYFASPRAEQVATEPFDAVAGGQVLT